MGYVENTYSLSPKYGTDRWIHIGVIYLYRSMLVCSQVFCILDVVLPCPWLINCIDRYTSLSSPHSSAITSSSHSSTLPNDAWELLFSSPHNVICGLSYTDQLCLTHPLRYTINGVVLYLGYSIPTEVALFLTADRRYQLKFDFFTVFKDIWIEDLEIKVVLPEGAQDVQVNVPYAVEQSWSRRYSNPL